MASLASFDRRRGAGRPAIARSQLFVVSGESAEPHCGLQDYACR